MTCVCLRWFVLRILPWYITIKPPFWGCSFFPTTRQANPMTLGLRSCGTWTGLDFKSRNPWRNHEVNVAVNIVGCYEQKNRSADNSNICFLLRQKKVWRAKHCWRQTLYFWLIRHLSTVVWGVRSHQPPKFSRKHQNFLTQNHSMSSLPGNKSASLPGDF